jgi:hypothetical protein
MSGVALPAFLLLLAVLSVFRRRSFSVTGRIEVITTSARLSVSRRFRSNRTGFRNVA